MKRNLNVNTFNSCYNKAYRKMVTFSAAYGKKGPVKITGYECFSGYSGGYICQFCNLAWFMCPSYCYCASGGPVFLSFRHIFI